MKNLMRVLSYILVAAVAASLTLIFITVGGGREYSKLAELKDLINQVFIEEVDEAAIEDAAAAAMVDALGDRWSHYMTAEEFSSYAQQLTNSYVGIGVHIVAREDGYIDVVKVEPGGPAEEAGILPGDVLIAVGEQDICNLETEAVKALVVGEAGTKVILTVKRDGREITLEAERRTINSIVASGEMLDDTIGLVTIVNFESRCSAETIAAIEDLLEQGAKGIIFDVRYNPGGYKHELVRLLDYLLPEGPLFRSVDYNGEETVDMSDAACLDIPMVVLLNGDSYSAAEFFAAALNEYGVAKLVGEPSTGKGHFQSAFELADGSAAIISIGKYRTPNGNNLDRVGLTPDVTVEVDDVLYMNIYYGTVEPADDPQVQAALSLLRDTLSQ